MFTEEGCLKYLLFKLREVIISGGLTQHSGTYLRAVCCKDQLRSCNIEKTDFPKLCQNKGLGELVLKIQVSGRLDFYVFFGNFFCILRSQRPKLTPKLGIFRKLPFKK